MLRVFVRLCKIS